MKNSQAHQNTVYCTASLYKTTYIRRQYTTQETQTALLPNYWFSFGKASPTAWFYIASVLLGKCNKKCSTRLPRPPASHRGGPRPRSTLVVPGCAGACTTRRSWKDKRWCRVNKVEIYTHLDISDGMGFKSHQPEFPVHFFEKMSGSSNDISRSVWYRQCLVHSGYVHILIVIEPTSWRDRFYIFLRQPVMSMSNFRDVCQDSSEL